MKPIMREKICATTNKDIESMSIKEIMDTPVTLTLRELVDEMEIGVNRLVEEKMKEKISSLSPKSVITVTKDPSQAKMIVDLHWSSQFCGMADKIVIVPASLTKEEIEKKLFPQELGMEYDENCWYDVNYLISPKTLYKLYENATSFKALATGGVNSWEWCGVAYENFLEDADTETTDFDEFVEEQFKKNWGNIVE